MAKKYGDSMESKGLNVAGPKSPGKAVGEDGLGHAVDCLYEQHPEKWNDLGPHHAERGAMGRGMKPKSA